MSKAEALQAALTETLEKFGVKLQSPAGGETSVWGAPPPSDSEIMGVALEMNVDTPKGKLKVYISLKADVLDSPDKLMSAIEGLAAKGLPLNFWKKKEDWNQGRGGGGGGGYNRGGQGRGW